MTEIPKIISVDDHVVEPADVWQKRLPKKYLDVGPRVVRAPLGEMTLVGGNFSYEKGEGNPCDWWHYEDKKIPQTRLSAAVGFDRDEVKITAITYEEMRPGCYDPKARLEDMDVNWVEASLSFPTFPRFCGQTFMEAKDMELADSLMSGVFEKFPDLTIAYSEGQMGWIRYVLERADAVWDHNRAWGGVADKVKKPPSQYYREHVYGCFFDDPHGLRSLEDMGVDTITFETDYPHSDSTWPNSKEVAERQMKDLDEDQIQKIVRGNAIRMLQLDLT